MRDPVYGGSTARALMCEFRSFQLDFKAHAT
jgi:hypothetical protein